MDICRQQEPPFKDYGDGHYAACFLYEDGAVYEGVASKKV